MLREMSQTILAYSNTGAFCQKFIYCVQTLFNQKIFNWFLNLLAFEYL